VGIRFTDDWVFRNVSLSIPARGSLALIGPSGAGKSVLLKIIACLIRPSEGLIKLDSKNIGMLFQKNALFDSFTVEENLLFPLKERTGIVGKSAKDRAAHFLSAVGLKGSEGLYPDEISGGMQKRLGIARALIVEPEIILYDEPTAGLDPITSRTIADLIIQLRGETESTLLTVTNDVQRAYQLGDRIALLAQGSLLMGGTPSQVQNTKEPALHQFIYGLKDGPLTSGLG
jgi:phospholipid/cholesterol/gamma-HCH transport system ATP-binding protein